LAFLYGRIDYERTPTIPYQAQHLKLDRMHCLLEHLGNPHHGLRVVHVAGSKGKGSTATMIAAVLTASGYRTGLYTSPHLQRLEERLSVDGVDCRDAELLDLVEFVVPAVRLMDEESSRRRGDENGPTYFEITTALAFLYFVRRKVDMAVMEVGLGGRLDSTNVCQPVVSVITSISLDHTKQLGNTLSAIAREKAGIIKSGVPLVNGVREGPARRVIETTARARSSQLSTLGVDFDFRYHVPRPVDSRSGVDLSEAKFAESIDYREMSTNLEFVIDDLQIGMLGRHQAANAAIAIRTLCRLRDQFLTVPETAMRQGLAGAFCPGRIEIMSRKPSVIVDAAHNVASIRALIETLQDHFPVGRRVLVFGTTRGKDARGMLRELTPRFDRVILTQYSNNPRSVDPDELARFIREEGNDRSDAAAPEWFTICHDSQAAWILARESVADTDLICVTGSFFLAAELRPVVAAQRRGSREAARVDNSTPVASTSPLPARR
jgi:dihydrofolate synthase/folylpolyglutamate synthase